MYTIIMIVIRIIIWQKKGSRVYQEKPMNAVHALSFDFNTTANTFCFGNTDSDNYILKMARESTDASAIIRNMKMLVIHYILHIMVIV